MDGRQALYFAAGQIRKGEKSIPDKRDWMQVNEQQEYIYHEAFLKWKESQVSQGISTSGEDFEFLIWRAGMEYESEYWNP